MLDLGGSKSRKAKTFILALLFVTILCIGCEKKEVNTKIYFSHLGVENKSAVDINPKIIIGTCVNDIFGVVSEGAIAVVGFGEFEPGDYLAVIWSTYDNKPARIKEFDPKVLMGLPQKTKVTFIFYGDDKWEIKTEPSKY